MSLEVMALNRLDKKQSEYPWMTIVCCFLMVFTALGFCSSPKQLFLKATTEALQIDRTLYSFNTTFRYAALAVMNLVFATLVYKVRTRLLVGFGFACLIGSTLCYAMADNVLLIYVGGTLLGVGMCFTANTMANYIITARCKKNTGTILGFVMASNGLGGAVAEYLSENCPVPMVRHGVNDEFGRSGTAAAVLEHYGITAEGLCAKIREALAKK